MNFFTAKTPHKNPLNHARNLLLYFIGAAALVIFTSCGVEASTPVVATIAALVAGSVAMVGGLLVTMVLRQVLGLVQTGRVLQYAGFWVASLAGVQAAGLFFDETFILVNPFLSALAIFAVAFGAATAAGEIPWKGRTWLPVKRSN